MEVIPQARNKLVDIVFYMIAAAIFVRYAIDLKFLFTASEDAVFESVYELSGSIDAFVLFQSIYLFFYRKISFKWSCVLAIAGYAMAHFLFLEEVFPAWLHEIGWGNWIKNEEEPRGMIIIGTALISIFYFFHPRLRSFERTLNLMLLLSIIGTFILFHFIMIKGAMRDVERNFSTMLTSSRISDPARYEALCGDLAYNCIKVKNGEIIDRVGVDDVDMTGHIYKKYLSNMTQPSLLATNVITKENGHMRNYSLYAEKKDDTIYAAFEMRHFQILKRRISNGFYRLNVVAHFVWTVFVLFLIWLHRELRRKPKLKAFFKP